MSRLSFGQPPYRNGGRSPLAAYAPSPADRSLSDLYTYTDDQHNVLSPRDIQTASVFEDDEAPDLVHIRFQGESWRIEFPPYSIAEEKVQVRHVRDRVAHKIGLDGKEGRVKLLYKDRELKRNDTPLKIYGCKQNSEITAILTQEVRNYNGPRERSGSESDSIASSRKSADDDRRPHRAYSTNRRRVEDQEPRSAYPSSSSYLHPHDTPPTGNTPPRRHSPIRPTQSGRQSSPTYSAPPRSSAPAVQPPRANASTPLGKIQVMRYEFLTDWYPKIEDFLRFPPSDREERTKEYRRLNEIAMKRVFEPGDLIEAEGPDKEEIRATRKQLYHEAQGILNELDKFKPRDSK